MSTNQTPQELAAEVAALGAPEQTEFFKALCTAPPRVGSWLTYVAGQGKTPGEDMGKAFARFAHDRRARFFFEVVRQTSMVTADGMPGPDGISLQKALEDLFRELTSAAKALGN